MNECSSCHRVGARLQSRGVCPLSLSLRAVVYRQPPSPVTVFRGTQIVSTLERNRVRGVFAVLLFLPTPSRKRPIVHGVVPSSQVRLVILTGQLLSILLAFFCSFFKGLS